ncbi:hypothetical protein KL929_003560 [Ogataea haglerorum]|nr:hypothetical protein KL951_003590 [Ogataea haglerorum]KAG7746705.1 hypothetical protein KL912_003834 [Ogataea haglerorum]KAG7786517.1 hypothetical protein KL910_003917 [Ogataea haglerorum]KAG7787742.1 hypothetical protein KL945_002891 [Ogataea haglerorum]KAG7796369.1 hypothetical protein KL929_003560 [Ogataea haglerorum]
MCIGSSQGPEFREVLAPPPPISTAGRCRFRAGLLGSCTLTFREKPREDSGILRGIGGRVDNIRTDLLTQSYRVRHVLDALHQETCPIGREI